MPDPPPVRQLDHSVLGVSNWDVSNAFYRDVLGADIIEQEPGRWAYRIGSTQLNVHGPDVERGWGTSVYVRDPDGSLLELIAYD